MDLKNLTQKELFRVSFLIKKTKEELIDSIIKKDNFFKNYQSDLHDLTQNELIEMILKQNKSTDELIEIINESKKDVMEIIDEPKKDVTEDKPKKDVIEDDLNTTQIKETDKALKGYTKSYEINIINKKNPLEQLQNTRTTLKNHLQTLLNEFKGLKFIEILKVTFTKVSNNEIINKTAYFNCKAHTIINNIDITESLNLSEQYILNFIAIWISEGSGWTIKSIDNHYLNIVKYKPINGSSYIQLPIELQNSAKGLINLKNDDTECFRWCHIRFLNPKLKNQERITKYDKEYIKKLNYDKIDFPVCNKNYNKIEKQNDININVFGYESKQAYPLYISKENYTNCMNLLLITKDKNKHYVLIKDFNKFMYNQTKHKERKHFCMYCLQCFSSERILNDHKVNCLQVNGTQAIKMPTKDNNILKFENYYKQQKVPFVIYADFESISEKVQGCKPNDKKSYTTAYQKHTDCGYGYKVVCCYDDYYSKPINIYRGEKAVYKFMEKMLEEVDYCKNILKTNLNKKLEMTDDDEKKFKNSTICHICNKQYKEKDIKVRYHHPINNKYIDSAHKECKLKLQVDPDKIKIPVIFHNLRGYDSHFSMQEIGDIVKNHTYKNKKGKIKQMNINCIPNNMEKYMAFMFGNNLQFIDSFQFMSSSLDKLVSNLPNKAFKYTQNEFKNEKFVLMKRKGIYPYDYMDSFDKFNNTKLPSKDEFYSTLNNEHINNEDYKHAKNVWKTFDIKSMGDYHNLYLKSDILLLADVFENFRKTCLNYYKLDPCHYFSSPGLSWDSMLKMTNIKLELITDIDMFQFIEKGMRGGISYIANRHSKANNKHMNDYDENEPSKYIMYLDANNLYGWAMSQYLPTGKFKWLTQKQIDETNLAKYDERSKKGLILEVDLEYSKELHDLHNDYPLACEKVKVSKDMLSDYCKKIADKYNISNGLVHKLIPTLNNKEKYVLHYRNLQLYLDLGLKITKVHRALEFNQSNWLKQYIDFNTEKPKNTENAFEKDFFKLMNNSVYGKTMENVRKRVDVKLITDEKKLLKITSKPTYVSCKIFNENLVAVHKIKEQLILNKPAYLGMCILDLSKTLMYDFHYNYIKNKYRCNAKLLFTDTDSLCYQIETNDVYEDFFNNKDKFDFSEYDKNSKYFDNTNKKVIGKFKDESTHSPIIEFIGLRSKMYSYIKDDDNENRTAKGIKKNVIKNDINHQNYKETLNNQQLHHKMKTIRSINHNLSSYEINKVSLSCFDDKRYILNDGINSYAYGHYKINKK